MKARIYSPSKSASQSGLGRPEQWVLEYEAETARKPEALMGWTSCADNTQQIRLKFFTSEDAQAYAKRMGLKYSLSKPHERKVKPRNYGDNFKYVPEEKN